MRFQRAGEFRAQLNFLLRTYVSCTTNIKGSSRKLWLKRVGDGKTDDNVSVLANTVNVVHSAFFGIWGKKFTGFGLWQCTECKLGRIKKRMEEG